MRPSANHYPPVRWCDPLPRIAFESLLIDNQRTHKACMLSRVSYGRLKIS